MHYLPLSLLRSNLRNPQSEWGDILPCANLGLGPLHPHNVAKLRSYVRRHVLKGNNLAITELRCGTLHGLSDLLPSTRRWAKGVSEAYVFSVG
jgi:hypothetical protein